MGRTIQDLKELHLRLLRSHDEFIGHLRDSSIPEVKAMLGTFPRYSDEDVERLLGQAMNRVTSGDGVNEDRVREILADVLARNFDRQQVKLHGPDSPATDLVKWS